MKNNPAVKTIVLSLIVYIVTTALSFSIFKLLNRSTTETTITSPEEQAKEEKKAKFRINPDLPRTEECPLNGIFYTKKEQEIWAKRRPLGMMISNSTEGRPVEGLSLADIVYEAVSEGGVTRYMPIYYCGASLGNIEAAPVRSARSSFIDWISEYDGLYNHVGGSNRIGENETKTDAKADAIGQIRRYGIKDLDQFGIGYPDCYRNPDRVGREVATEHTMVCQTDNLFKIAAERDWTNVDEDGVAWDENFTSWKLKDDADISTRPESQTVDFGFWENYTDYSVRWVYDKQTNSYSRYNGSTEKQVDPITEEPIQAKNIVVQLTPEIGPIDENKHILYETIGDGKAIIFQDGQAIVGKWVKKNRLSRTLYYDSKGTEIKFTRGQIWIEIIPDDNKVAY